MSQRDWGVNLNAPEQLRRAGIRDRTQEYAEKIRSRRKQLVENKRTQSPEPKRCTPRSFSPIAKAPPPNVLATAASFFSHGSPSPYFKAPRAPLTARETRESDENCFVLSAESEWCTRHHVTWSMGNTVLPRNRRIYFDPLPQVRVIAGTYNDVPLYWPDSGADTNRHRMQRSWQRQHYPFSTTTTPLPNLPKPATGEGVLVDKTQNVPADVTAPSTPVKEEESVVLPPLETDKRDSRTSVMGVNSTIKAVKKFKRQKMKAPLIKKSSMAEVPSAAPLSHFVDWCIEKFGHVVRVWRVLDKDGNMRLSKQECTRGLNQLMYRGGDLARLWNILDRDQSGWVSFLHFAAEDAFYLAHFKRWIELNFDSAAALFRLLDVCRDGRLSFREFDQGLRKLGFAKAFDANALVRTLFELIDDAGDESSMRKITADELIFLDKWEIPEYLWEEPEFGAVEPFLKAVIAKYKDNPLLAWRRALDTDSSMRVSYYEFIKAFKTMSQKGVFQASIAKSVPGLFRALDRHNTGWLSLRDFDEPTYDGLIAFWTWARAEYGKVSQCCKALAPPEGGDRVRFGPFKKAVREGFGLSQDDARLLFQGLSLETKTEGTIKPDELFFLDRWDPAAEREEEEAWSRMVIDVEAQIKVKPDICADDS